MSVLFVFQQTKIWDGASRDPDPSQPQVSVKLQKDDEAKARRKLGASELGRDWILIKKEVLR